MIHGDNLLSSSTSMRSTTERDVPTEGSTPKERATPQPTVLSTVWEGPTEDHSADRDSGYPRALDLEAVVVRSRLLRWLFAPATRRRALIITTVAAVVCGGVLAVGEMDARSPEVSTAPTEGSIDSTGASLSSRAVASGAADEQTATSDHEGALGEERAATAQVADRDSITQEAVSADERIQLTAKAVQTPAGGWILEAQVVNPAESDPVVRFTVNGAIVGEVERAPYRLPLNAEVLASSSSVVVGEGQPLIVTATALWPDGGDAASPATVVLAN